MQSTIISQDIEDLRRRLGLTQGALALRLGVSRITVNRWQRGHYVPSLKYWLRLKELVTEAGYAGEARE